MGFIKVLTSGPNEALIISGKEVRFRPYFSTNPTFKKPTSFKCVFEKWVFSKAHLKICNENRV